MRSLDLFSSELRISLTLLFLSIIIEPLSAWFLYSRRRKAQLEAQLGNDAVASLGTSSLRAGLRRVLTRLADPSFLQDEWADMTDVEKAVSAKASCGGGAS